MSWKFYICFLAMLALLHTGNVWGQQNVPDECEDVGSETLVTYAGWPFQLYCSELFDNFTTNSQCHVSEGHRPPVLSNITLKINSTTTFIVSLVLNDVSCRSKKITVELRSLTSRSSFESVDYDFTNNINVVHLNKIFGNSIFFNCLPPSNKNDNSTYKLALPSSYNVTWWRTQRYENGTLANEDAPFYSHMFTNYTNLVENFRLARLIFNPPSPQSIQKYTATYFDPAVYSCELQYKEERAFITHQELCIENEITDITPMVLCNEIISFEEGENVLVQCNVHSSNRMIEPSELEVQWAKEGTDGLQCTYLYQSEEEVTANDPRYNCSINDFPNLPQKCFTYVPTNQELSNYPDAKSFSVQFNIRTANENDAGNYTVELRYRNRLSSPTSIQLAFRGTQKGKNPYVVAISALGLSAIVLFVLVLVSKASASRS